MPKSKPNPTLSIAQAADLAGVSKTTIRRRIESGELKAYRFGPRLLKIDTADIETLFSPANPQAVEHINQQDAYKDLETAARRVARIGGIAGMQRDHIIELIGGGEAA
jgi:excisionase family DNA binding protein